MPSSGLSPTASPRGRASARPDRDHATDVTDNEIATGKIALAQMNKFPDYYTRLAQMEPKPNRSWHRATDWIV